MARSFAGGSSIEKALNLRLFTKSCDHPQWRSGYARSGQLEGTGFNSAETFFFPSSFFFFFVLFCFVCLFVLLFFLFFCFCFVCLFVLLFFFVFCFCF